MTVLLEEAFLARLAGEEPAAGSESEVDAEGASDPLSD